MSTRVYEPSPLMSRYDPIVLAIALLIFGTAALVLFGVGVACLIGGCEIRQAPPCSGTIRIERVGDCPQ